MIAEKAMIEILITCDPIAPPAPIAYRNAGAVIDFYGIVRELESGEAIHGIEYEAFEDMAHEQLRIIAERIANDYDIREIHCMHRTGFVAAGQCSLFLRVASEHREEAYAASAQFIEHLKRDVPIWKRIVSV